MNLEFLFNPKSVAVVGVSSDPTKLGSVVFTNMRSAGYSGKLFAVNPKYSEVFDSKCYPSVSLIEEDVDIVCIVVPPNAVKEVVIDSARKNVKGIMIITAGFSETGAEGSTLEKEIVQIAKEHNIKILGPNCLGSIVPRNKVNLSFAATNAIDGDIAFLSQSGAFCTAILDMSLETNLGFSHLVSIGNKADLDENDFIQNWIDNPSVKVMGAYLEDIRSGYDLSKIYKSATFKKPLVLFKPGESEESQLAISSHTGSLAGSIEVFETAMEQSGITIAKDIDSMFNLLQGFAWSKLPKGNRVGILTNAGGPGVIATDFIIKNNLELNTLSENIQKHLRENLPSNANVHNPVDVIGDANSERYKTALEIMIQDEDLDAIIVMLTPQLVTEVEETAKIIINNFKVSTKPIIPVFLGGRYISYAMKRFYDNKVPAYRDISSAVETLSALYKYYKYNFDRSQLQSKLWTDLPVERMTSTLNATNIETVLDEDTVMSLALEVGIKLPRQKLVGSIQEAIDFARNFYPVVVKAPTSSIVHKTDKKAIYLNINSDEELINAFNNIQSLIGNEKVLIQKQLKSDAEIFIGVKRDGGSDVYKDNSRGFGHLIAFGHGGIYTEIYKDVQYSLTPASRSEIQHKLRKTKIYKIIDGARGKPKLAEEKLLNVIESVQKLVKLYPEISSLDINPLMLTEDDAVVVDMKIFVKN